MIKIFEDAFEKNKLIPLNDLKEGDYILNYISKNRASIYQVIKIPKITDEYKIKWYCEDYDFSEDKYMYILMNIKSFDIEYHFSCLDELKDYFFGTDFYIIRNNMFDYTIK